MGQTNRMAFETRVASLTDRFLDRIQACVRAFESAVDAHFDGESLDEAVAEVSSLESECDEALRDVREAVAGMPPAFSQLYLRPGEAVTFFDRTDVVANRAESLAVDLRAMNVDLAAVAESVRAMVADVVAMVEALAEAAETHFSDPLGDGDPERLRSAVGEIRERERRCDERRRAAVRAAFADGPSAAALATREVVQSLDGVADAVEDAADHLAYVERVAR